MKRLLLALALLCGLATAQVDIRVNNIGPYIDLARNVNWSNGPGALGNNYIVTPSTPDQGVCLYVTNNAASLRSFTVSFVITGDQTNNTYLGNTGAWIVVYQSIGDVDVPASATIARFVKLTAAARLAVIINSTSQAGTASAFVVFTTSGGCGLLSPNPVSLPFRIFTDKSLQLTTAYSARACVTNPATGNDILSLQSNTPSPLQGVYLDKIRISSSVAADIDLDEISTTGTTCGAVTPYNQSQGQGAGNGLLAKSVCSGADPVVFRIIHRTSVPASDTREVDLQGLYSQSTGSLGTSHGLYMVTVPAGVTGVVCAEFQWAEAQ